MAQGKRDPWMPILILGYWTTKGTVNQPTGEPALHCLPCILQGIFIDTMTRFEFSHTRHPISRSIQATATAPKLQQCLILEKEKRKKHIKVKMEVKDYHAVQVFISWVFSLIKIRNVIV